MDEDAIKEYLREHLCVSVSIETERYNNDGVRVTVSLLIDGKVFSESDDCVKVGND